MSARPAPSASAAERSTNRRLVVRGATPDDIEAIVSLTERVYTPEFAYTRELVAAHLNRFAAGAFVAVHDGAIVGYSASFRVDEALAFAPHTWRGITGGGYASRHDPEGDWLYGMESCVDPGHRNLRIGRRLYDRRFKLCAELGLRGVVFGGRMPGYARRRHQFPDPLDYAHAVEAGRVRDPTLRFQLRNGFRIVGVLSDYLPMDAASAGCAAHLVRANPRVSKHPAHTGARQEGGLPATIRVAVLQLRQAADADAGSLLDRVAYYAGVASLYRVDFLVLPEYATLQLVGNDGDDAGRRPGAAEIVERSAARTAQWRDALSALAVRHAVNIVGGTHLDRRADGSVRNVCFVCLRNGTVHEQEKLHPTPDEHATLGVRGGAHARAIPTDCGPIGVAICYDIEFPEVARHLADQGALLLFVPFATDEERGYLRVRHCAQARAIENQCFVALAGSVGQIRHLDLLNLYHARSCILTPCDFAFARDGVAAESSADVETMTVADLHLDDLIVARNEGTVRNLEDRRFDLYRVTWR